MSLALLERRRWADLAGMTPIDDPEEVHALLSPGSNNAGDIKAWADEIVKDVSLSSKFDGFREKFEPPAITTIKPDWAGDTDKAWQNVKDFWNEVDNPPANYKLPKKLGWTATAASPVIASAVDLHSPVSEGTAQPLTGEIVNYPYIIDTALGADYRSYSPGAWHKIAEHWKNDLAKEKTNIPEETFALSSLAKSRRRQLGS